MKTTNIGTLLVLVALSVAAQGTVRFENNIPGVLVTHVYAAHPNFPPGTIQGNGPSDYPRGGQDWTDWMPAAGSGFSAQLWAAPGADAIFGFKPASPITTFQTGGNAGFVVPVIATLDGVPADAPVATVRMVAWDNQNGTINTWQEAQSTSPSWW
jgi:hypothetical protein